MGSLYIYIYIYIYIDRANYNASIISKNNDSQGYSSEFESSFVLMLNLLERYIPTLPVLFPFLVLTRRYIL